MEMQKKSLSFLIENEWHYVRVSFFSLTIDLCLDYF